MATACKKVKNLTAKDLLSGCLLNLGDSLVTYINFERKNHMEVDKKIKKLNAYIPNCKTRTEITNLIWMIYYIAS